MGFILSKFFQPREEEKNLLIVTGLTSSGKTHFLDMFYFGSDTTKRPTIGFYEVLYENFILREIGGSMNWKLMIESLGAIDGIFHIVDASSSDEQIMQSRNLLLGVCDLLKTQKIVVFLNRQPLVNKKRIIELLQLKELGEFRRVLLCDLDFETQEWQEKVSEVFEWVS